MSLNIVSDLDPAKVKELQAIVGMLPHTLKGHEVHCYIQLVLAAFLPEAEKRFLMAEFLYQTERQLLVMTRLGLDNFPTSEC